MRQLVEFAIQFQSYSIFIMSRQQNPPTIHQAPSQPAEDVKPFSIRQYVNACRHKNMLNCWPFPDKYLQMCLNLGLINVNDVLPPFGNGFQASSNLMHSQNDSSKLEAEQFCKTHEVQHVNENQINIKNECDSLSHAEYEEENINLCESADKFTVPTSIHDVQKKAMKDKQGRRGRKKCKKRSMVDILAVARQCTLEEIHRMNKFSYVDHQAVTQGCDQQKMMPGGENSFRKGGRGEDHEAANNGDVTEKGALVLKFKLNVCNVNGNREGI